MDKLVDKIIVGVRVQLRPGGMLGWWRSRGLLITPGRELRLVPVDVAAVSDALDGRLMVSAR